MRDTRAVFVNTGRFPGLRAVTDLPFLVQEFLGVPLELIRFRHNPQTPLSLPGDRRPGPLHDWYPDILGKNNNNNNNNKRKRIWLPPIFLWNPKVVTAVTEPSLFLAVQTYVPVSSTKKSWIVNTPSLTVLRPFGKAPTVRVHVITDGG